MPHPDDQPKENPNPQFAARFPSEEEERARKLQAEQMATQAMQEQKAQPDYPGSGGASPSRYVGGETQQQGPSPAMKEAIERGFAEKVPTPRGEDPSYPIVQEPTLQYFSYQHLPPHLVEISRPFAALAYSLVKTLPRNPARTTALTQLCMAKDWAVRAYLYK